MSNEFIEEVVVPVGEGEHPEAGDAMPDFPEDEDEAGLDQEVEIEVVEDEDSNTDDNSTAETESSDSVAPVTSDEDVVSIAKQTDRKAKYGRCPVTGLALTKSGKPRKPRNDRGKARKSN